MADESFRVTIGETVLPIVASTQDAINVTVRDAIDGQIKVAITEVVFPIVLADNDPIHLQLIGQTGPQGPQGEKGDIGTANELELQFPWNINYDTLYSEPTEFDSDENITQIKYWESSAKIQLLYTKVIIYTDGNPTLIILVDNISDKIFTSTISYDLNGDWVSTNKIIS